MATVDHNNLTASAWAKGESGIISQEGNYVHFWPAVRLGDALAGREDFREAVYYAWNEVRQPE